MNFYEFVQILQSPTESTGDSCLGSIILITKGFTT